MANKSTQKQLSSLADKSLEVLAPHGEAGGKIATFSDDSKKQRTASQRKRKSQAATDEILAKLALLEKQNASFKKELQMERNKHAKLDASRQTTPAEESKHRRGPATGATQTNQ